KRQRGNTKTMIFDCRYIVWCCSQYFVLEPGDVIITGTPPGVGLGMKPPQFLKAGDVVTLGIDGLGEQRQEVVKFKMGGAAISSRHTKSPGPTPPGAFLMRTNPGVSSAAPPPRPADRSGSSRRPAPC